MQLVAAQISPFAEVGTRIFRRYSSIALAEPRVANRTLGHRGTWMVNQARGTMENKERVLGRVRESTAGAAKDRRNPSWTRDELLLALQLYLNHREAPPGKTSSEVAELSDTLNRLRLALGSVDLKTYRNPNGVYMKLMNFRSIDPDYTRTGRVGLTRGNRDESVVWGEYAHDPERLGRVCAAIRAAITDPSIGRSIAGDDEIDVQEAAEGKVLTRLHRIRERSSKLAREAKKAALQRAGKLACEACGTVFAERYGPKADGIIDVHHKKPLHTLRAGDRTRLEDLALLCANCHRVVHSSRTWLSVEDVASMLTNASTKPP